MGFKPYSDLKYTQMPDPVAMFNGIRAEASDAYKNRIPEATRNNISEVMNPLLTYPNLYNEMYPQLINRIAFTTVASKMYNNPLRMFKQGFIPVGRTVQEIFVDLIKAEPFYTIDAQGRTDCEDAFKQRLGNIKTMYHTLNRQDKYPITLSYEMLKGAAASWDELDTIIRKQVEALYTSDNLDEFLLMKNLFNEAGRRGALAEIIIPDGTDLSTVQETMTIMRSTVLNAGFMRTDYNYSQVQTFSNPENLVIFCLPEFLSRIDVVGLAAAFHMEKADFLANRVIVLDDFGGIESEGVKALMVDSEWFRVWDNEFTVRTQPNGARLYDNMFLHHWQTLSYSFFKTAIAFTIKEAQVLTVTINPTDLTLTRNNSDNPTATLLQAEVEGEGMYNPGVVWSTTIGKISPDGLLEVPNNWQGNSGTVTAISKQDGSVLDTIQVKLVPNRNVSTVQVYNEQNARIDTVDKVQLTRTNDILEYPLFERLTGTAVQDVPVRWTTTAGEISDDGILRLDPSIPQTEITVTAYASDDDLMPPKKATVTFDYLPAPGVYGEFDLGLRYDIGDAKSEDVNAISGAYRVNGRVSRYDVPFTIYFKGDPQFLGCTQNDLFYVSSAGKIEGNTLYLNNEILNNKCIVECFSRVGNAVSLVKRQEFTWLYNAFTLVAAGWYTNSKFYIEVSGGVSGAFLTCISSAATLVSYSPSLLVIEFTVSTYNTTNTAINIIGNAGTIHQYDTFSVNTNTNSMTLGSTTVQFRNARPAASTSSLRIEDMTTAETIEEARGEYVSHETSHDKSENDVLRETFDDIHNSVEVPCETSVPDESAEPEVDPPETDEPAALADDAPAIAKRKK